jgi:rhamnulokinase
MNRYYVACDLGAECGRVLLGTLHRDQLTISEVRRFPNAPVQEKNSLVWNVSGWHAEILAALRDIGAYEEPVDGLSCSSWPADYLLFTPGGSLLEPAYHHDDPRAQAGMSDTLSAIPWESLYEETGVHQRPANTIFQLAAEKPRRLKHSRLLPVADGIHYMLCGVPRAEMSLASATQLFNPVTRAWSERLLKALRLPPGLLPAIVPAGTVLGALRPEILRETRLEDAQVVASCSHELAAALAGLPAARGESWAFLRVAPRATMGTELIGPIISDTSRDLDYTNEAGCGGSVRFSKQVVGLWVLDECKRFWKERDRELYDDVLTHLAISAPPFESLIDPADSRFRTPGDMPLKIQAFCKETGQPVPRKPGPILRCVLESLALQYRKTLEEIEGLTGRRFTRLFLLNGSGSPLLCHFIANALQLPVALAPADATAIGNVIVQALALGHLESLDQARDLVRTSFRMETITPRAAVWNAAYDRLAELVTA